MSNLVFNPFRGPQNTNNRPTRMDGDQKIYERLQMCTCFRETLKKGENFDEAKAINVMERNLNKRQAHGYANLLEDRFTLEKMRANGRDMFRTWLGYREITDIQRSTTRPQFFVLSIQSAMSNKRYYEVYKCHSEEDSQKFETLIREALGSPDFRIHGENTFATVAVSEEPKRERSLAHIEFQSSLESLEEDSKANGAYQQANSTASEGCAEKAPIPEPIHIETYVHAAPPPPSSPVAALSVEAEQAAETECVTFIAFDTNTRQPVVSDDGPAYMYMHRERFQ
ncbi:unnamed protein product [Calicophoron daubneyi]